MDIMLGENEEQQSREVVEIANDVIQIIAGLAASRAEGVVAMSGGITEGIAERLGRKNLSKGVKVELEEGKAKIDVFIIARYGVLLHELFREIQKNVKNAVESMTGLTVEEVNVYTQGISLEGENVEEEKEEHFE